MRVSELIIGKRYFISTGKGTTVCKYNGRDGGGRYVFVGRFCVHAFPKNADRLVVVSPTPDPLHWYEWGNALRGCVSIWGRSGDSVVDLGDMLREEVDKLGLSFKCPHP